ncbi:flagellar filament capping protein FliD [Fredinandcohnia humi]
MRISGLATGMDIDQMVKDLMKAERIPLDKLRQKKQILEWQRDDYRSMNSLLLSLRNEAFNMRLSTAFNSKKTSSTNESKVSATASTAAGNATYKFENVSLATAAYNNGGAISVSSTAKVDPLKSLWEMRDSFVGSSNGPGFSWNSYNEYVGVKEDGVDFQLSKSLKNTDSIKNNQIQLIAKDGTVSNFNVVYDQSTLDLANEVYVDINTGKVKFFSPQTQGSIISVAYDDNEYFDNLDTLTVGENGAKEFFVSKHPIENPTNMRVSINSTSYQIVTDKTELDAEDEVLVDPLTGKLEFFTNSLTKDSKITVSYDGWDTNPSIVITEGLATQKAFDLSTSLKNDISSGVIKNGLSSGMKIDVVDKDGNVKSYTVQVDGTDPASGSDIVKVDTTNGKLVFGDTLTKDSRISISYDYQSFSFSTATYDQNGSVNVQNFDIKGNVSLNTVLSKVSNSTVGISAFYDEFTDMVSFTRKETGNFNTFGKEMIFGGDFIKNVLQISESNEVDGKNAFFDINGLRTERYSNTFSISGVTFTLKDAIANGESVSISVTNDTTQVFDTIKKFIDKYNETIEKIQSKLTEDRYRTYQPLTDEQREELSDKQQEQWEEKAKSGLLRRDSILSSGLNKLRMDFYTPITNVDIDSMYNQLSEIGITTTADYLEGGKLVIRDEAALRKAIEEDPKSVELLFRSSGSTYQEKGIVNRLYDSLTETMDKIKERAGNSNSVNTQFTIGKNIDNLDDRIDSFEDRLTQIEDRYYRQFTAMEKMIQQMNQQSTYLMQQFGGGY